MECYARDWKYVFLGTDTFFESSRFVTYRTVSQKVFDHIVAYSLPDLLGTC